MHLVYIYAADQVAARQSALEARREWYRMAERTWTFELSEPYGSSEDGFGFGFRKRTHTVHLRHSYWTTKRAITLDGVLLSPDQIRSYGVFGLSSDDLFMVDGHACVVHIRSNGITYGYDFAVDGVSVQSGKVLDIPIQVSQVTPGAKDKMPGWSWLFIALSIVVFFGALFAGFGLAFLLSKTQLKRPSFPIHFFVTPVFLHGLYSIVTASKEPGQTTKERMTKCAVVVGRTGLIIMGTVAAAILVLP